MSSLTATLWQCCNQTKLKCILRDLGLKVSGTLLNWLDFVGDEIRETLETYIDSLTDVVTNCKKNHPRTFRSKITADRANSTSSCCMVALLSREYGTSVCHYFRGDQFLKEIDLVFLLEHFQNPMARRLTLSALFLCVCAAFARSSVGSALLGTL